RATSDGGVTLGPGGRLHVVRANTARFSGNYPVALASPLTPAGFAQASAVVVDLDGDLKKEIVVAVVDLNRTQYTLLAFNADGTPFAAWPKPSFPATGLAQPLAAADLD